MNNWFNDADYVSPTFRNRAVGYQFLGNTNGLEPIKWDTVNNEVIFIGSGNFGTLNDAYAFTLPNVNAQGQPFFLSMSEMNRYFISGIGGQATHASAQAFRNDNGAAAFWWLRSPGSHLDFPVRFVYSNGNFGSNSATFTSRGFRPALWVTQP